MSEQNKSNVQALGAGLFGFVAVLAVGGGALMLHRSQQAGAANAAPVAAGAPVDLGAPMPAPRPPITAPKEGRAESPAPLIGEEEESESAAPVEASSRRPSAPAPTPEAEPAARPSSGRLEVTQHLETEAGSTSAFASVAAAPAPEKALKVSAKKAPVKKAPLAAEAGAGAIASVQYGATNRSELMGRAAGPVYNMKGSGPRPGSGAVGKMADDVNAKIADLQKQLEAAGMPADQRAKLQKDLEDVTKGAVAPSAAQ